jgi:protein deglycase
MAKVYEFLANGFEEVEALGPVDILRRGGVEVQTVSISDKLAVTSSHGVEVKADVLFCDAHLDDADILLIPGGMPGAQNIDNHEGVRRALLAQNAAGRRLGAICAGPMVLGHLGLLEGKRATCYPGFDKELTGATYTAEPFTIDGNIITGKGPGATFAYAYAILEMFVGKQAAAELKKVMMYE